MEDLAYLTPCLALDRDGVVMAEKVMLIMFLLRLDKLPHCTWFSWSNLCHVSTPRVNN